MEVITRELALKLLLGSVGALSEVQSTELFLLLKGDGVSSKSDCGPTSCSVLLEKYFEDKESFILLLKTFREKRNLFNLQDSLALLHIFAPKIKESETLSQICLLYEDCLVQSSNCSAWIRLEIINILGSLTIKNSSGNKHLIEALGRVSFLRDKISKAAFLSLKQLGEDPESILVAEIRKMKNNRDYAVLHGVHILQNFVSYLIYQKKYYEIITDAMNDLLLVPWLPLEEIILIYEQFPLTFLENEIHYLMFRAFYDERYLMMKNLFLKILSYFFKRLSLSFQFELLNFLLYYKYQSSNGSEAEKERESQDYLLPPCSLQLAFSGNNILASNRFNFPDLPKALINSFLLSKAKANPFNMLIGNIQFTLYTQLDYPYLESTFFSPSKESTSLTQQQKLFLEIIVQRITLKRIFESYFSMKRFNKESMMYNLIKFLPRESLVMEETFAFLLSKFLSGSIAEGESATFVNPSEGINFDRTSISLLIAKFYPLLNSAQQTELNKYSPFNNSYLIRQLLALESGSNNNYPVSDQMVILSFLHKLLKPENYDFHPSDEEISVIREKFLQLSMSQIIILFHDLHLEGHIVNQPSTGYFSNHPLQVLFQDLPMSRRISYFKELLEGASLYKEVFAQHLRVFLFFRIFKEFCSHLVPFSVLSKKNFLTDPLSFQILFTDLPDCFMILATMQKQLDPEHFHYFSRLLMKTSLKNSFDFLYLLLVVILLVDEEKTSDSNQFIQDCTLEFICFEEDLKTQQISQRMAAVELFYKMFLNLSNRPEVAETDVFLYSFPIQLLKLRSLSSNCEKESVTDNILSLLGQIRTKICVSLWENTHKKCVSLIASDFPRAAITEVEDFLHAVNVKNRFYFPVEEYLGIHQELIKIRDFNNVNNGSGSNIVENKSTDVCQTSNFLMLKLLIMLIQIVSPHEQFSTEMVTITDQLYYSFLQMLKVPVTNAEKNLDTHNRERNRARQHRAEFSSVLWILALYNPDKYLDKFLSLVLKEKDDPMLEESLTPNFLSLLFSLNNEKVNEFCTNLLKGFNLPTPSGTGGRPFPTDENLPLTTWMDFSFEKKLQETYSTWGALESNYYQFLSFQYPMLSCFPEVLLHYFKSLLTTGTDPKDVGTSTQETSSEYFENNNTSQEKSMKDTMMTTVSNFAENRENQISNISAVSSFVIDQSAPNSSLNNHLFPFFITMEMSLELLTHFSTIFHFSIETEEYFINVLLNQSNSEWNHYYSSDFITSSKVKTDFTNFQKEVILFYERILRFKNFHAFSVHSPFHSSFQHLLLKLMKKLLLEDLPKLNFHDAKYDQGSSQESREWNQIKLQLNFIKYLLRFYYCSYLKVFPVEYHSIHSWDALSMCWFFLNDFIVKTLLQPVIKQRKIHMLYEMLCLFSDFQSQFEKKYPFPIEKEQEKKDYYDFLKDSKSSALADNLLLQVNAEYHFLIHFLLGILLQNYLIRPNISGTEKEINKEDEEQELQRNYVVNEIFKFLLCSPIAVQFPEINRIYFYEVIYRYLTSIPPDRQQSFLVRPELVMWYFCRFYDQGLSFTNEPTNNMKNSTQNDENAEFEKLVESVHGRKVLIEVDLKQRSNKGIDHEKQKNNLRIFYIDRHQIYKKLLIFFIRKHASCLSCPLREVRTQLEYLVPDVEN
jgi:hypothetical protein